MRVQSIRPPSAEQVPKLHGKIGDKGSISRQWLLLHVITLFRCSQLDNADPAQATSVRVMLEGSVGPGYWMGFGFNDPKLTQARRLEIS